LQLCEFRERVCCLIMFVGQQRLALSKFASKCPSYYLCG
jgi:hypothetical protein